MPDNENGLGIEILKGIVSYAVNLGEAVVNADSDKDGNISAREALDIVYDNGLDLFRIIKQSGEALAEIKDLDFNEAKDLVNTIVNELDKLSPIRKRWVKQTSNNIINLIRLGLEAPMVW